jgi:hypothetical protein
MSEKQGSDSPAKKRKHFKEQFEEEDTLLVFRKHPIIMRKGLILASFGMLIGPLYTLALIYIHKNNPPSIAFFFASILASFILACILMFPWWVRWYFSVYIMTNKRFIQQTRSLLQVNVVDIGLDQIQIFWYNSGTDLRGRFGDTAGAPSGENPEQDGAYFTRFRHPPYHSAHSKRGSAGTSLGLWSKRKSARN